MKKITLLIVSIFTCVVISAQSKKDFTNSIYQGQTTTNAKGKYPKKANGVILTTSFTDIGVAITEFEKAMLQLQIIPDKADADIGYLKMRAFNSKHNYDIQIMFTFAKINDTIMVTAKGLWNPKMNFVLFGGNVGVGEDTQDMQIQNTGGWGSLYKEAFSDFMEVIKILPCKKYDFTFVKS